MGSEKQASEDDHEGLIHGTLLPKTPKKAKILLTKHTGTNGLNRRVCVNCFQWKGRGLNSSLGVFMPTVRGCAMNAMLQKQNRNVVIHVGSALERIDEIVQFALKANRQKNSTRPKHAHITFASSAAFGPKGLGTQSGSAHFAEESLRPPKTVLRLGRETRPVTLIPSLIHLGISQIHLIHGRRAISRRLNPLDYVSEMRPSTGLPPPYSSKKA